MSDLAPIWLDAPCAALELWLEAAAAALAAEPRRHRMVAGRAAVRGRLAGGGRALARRWRDACRRCSSMSARARLHYRARGPAAALADVAAARGRCRQHRPATAATRPRNKLALMQRFGRVGFVERDARSGRGWWDSHMFRMVGMEPALQPPSFEQALQRVHPDDRERLMQHHRQAMQQAGRYETRYRLRCPTAGSATCRRWPRCATAPMAGRRRCSACSSTTPKAPTACARSSRSAAQLAEALELAKVSVWRIDLQRQRIHCNDIGFGFTGVRAARRGHGPGRDARAGASRRPCRRAARRRAGGGRQRRGRRRDALPAMPTAATATC